ncbi:UNVERIFIED_CONTAM: hypothetical protein RMT77_007634 [Armadillidium vulgare]
MGKCSWVAFERGAKAVLTFVFSHVGLCALVLGYSVAGAFLFSWLEQKAIVVPFNATEHIEKCIDQIFNISERHGLFISGDVSLWRMEIIEQMRLHDLDVTHALQEDRYDKTEEDLDERWSIINSLFYCVTAITTIGYGHIYPRTTHGRMVTIVYSLFGIPLMLLCLNNIGDSMASTFRFTYKRIFCCKAQKSTDNLPTASNPISASNTVRERPPYQPPVHYKPKRRNMLISPPISATIHRGSDLPPKPPIVIETNAPKSGSSSSSLGVSRMSSRPSQFSPRVSPCAEIDANSILAECAAYTGTPLPDLPVTESIRTISNREYDIVHTPNCSTPSPSPPGLSVPSLSQSIPSSPLSKDSPSVWFTEQEAGEPFLHIPSFGDGHYSAQSTRPTSPSSGWVDQNSVMSMGCNGRPWTNQDSSASVTWATPIEDEYPGRHREHRSKRPAGKTLVVYNTLSGDALKQQTKLQKKMALVKAKKGQLRNDATTVFTDPVSGQPVNGDLLGLNYRPIEIEPSDKDTRVPVFLVLLFVFSYLVMGAVLFSSLEPWHFLDSFYFCFITLSTIGFGDLVPGNLGYETRDAQIKLVALALYLIVGLAVLAMSFSLVQEEVVLKCKAFAQYIGLKDE